MEDKSTILHIVRNKVFVDSRVIRSARAVSAAFPNFDVKCVGYTQDAIEKGDETNFDVVQIPVDTWSYIPKVVGRFLKYIQWHRGIVNKFKNSKIALVHCHELTPILICLHLKYFTRCHIIYDAHELETECRTNRFDRIMRPFYKLVESIGIRFSSSVITVSESIREWYSVRFPSSNINVVYNCPEIRRSTISSDLDDDRKVKNRFIYCGGLVPGRGIDLYLSVFSERPDLELYFLGDGALKETVIEFAKTYENIRYLGVVKPEEVVNALTVADVSLCLIDDVTLTSRYCMPNKLFESIVAGLPIIGSNLPDLSKFLRDQKVGWVISYDRISLLQILDQLSAEDILSKRINSKEERLKFSWDFEKYKLINLYKCLIL